MGPSPGQVFGAELVEVKQFLVSQLGRGDVGNAAEDVFYSAGVRSPFQEHLLDFFALEVLL